MPSVAFATFRQEPGITADDALAADVLARARDGAFSIAQRVAPRESGTCAPSLRG
jgi:hypothetical protein